MKKLFLIGASVLATTLGMSAEKYVVWSGDDLAADEILIPVEYNHWWNNKAEVVGDNASVEGKALMFTSADGSAASSCGYIVNHSEAHSFDVSKLMGCDLVFNAKVEGQGDWAIRLTSPDADNAIVIPADGEYHSVRLNVANDYSAVLDYWRNSTGWVDNGEGGGKYPVFLFSPVGTGLDAESALYVNNVRYEDAVPMPEITAEASNITMNSAELSYNVTFAEGYTNTSVTVNGDNVAYSDRINLTGLTAKTEYTYTIVAKGEYDGEEYTAEKTVKFTTLRDLSVTPVWYGQTFKEGFTAYYSIAYNADKTLTVEAEIETEKETPEGDRNFHIYIGGNEWLKLHDDGTGVLTGTTESTFEEGSSITWEWYLPYSGGVYQETNTYVIGSENEKPVRSPRMSAKVTEISFDSATIEYEVVNADDFTNLVVKMNGEVVSGSPVKIEGLEENTEYTYTFNVTGEVNGETLTGNEVKVTFKTSRKDAVDLVYADYVKAELKNAHLVGETSASNRTFYVSLPFQVTYTANGEGKYEIDLSRIEKFDGLVPQIYWNGFQKLTKNDVTGLYEYNFGAQTADAEVAISHYLAYAGGVLDQRSAYTKWGMEQTRPELGEAANLELSISKQGVIAGEPFLISIKVADANGYYLPASDVTIEAAGVEIQDGVATVDQKGDYTITATSGNLAAEKSFICFISNGSTNLVSGTLPYAYSPFRNDDTVVNITDDNLESQAEWDCSDTEEHYMFFELGDKPMLVEGVTMVWEGAYAADYDIEFSINKFEADAPAAMIAREEIIDQNHTIEVRGNNATSVEHPIVKDGLYDAVRARYVAVKTKKALNAGWGIKPRDFKVFGSVDTAVEGVAAEDVNAPVEYYNLQGVRVADPVDGLYIRRQGNKAEKVLVK